MTQRLRVRVAATLIAIALLATATPAAAVPATANPTPNSTLAEKQAEAQRVENEISLLDQQLEIIVEQYNAAHQTLVDCQKQLKAAALDFESISSRYELQKEIFDLRLETLYRNSKFGGLEIILASRDFSDLIKRLEFLRAMADRDAQILSEVSTQREQIEQVQASLTALKDQQVKLEAELKAKKKTIEGQLLARQAYLATVRADIRAILDTEAARRDAEQAALLASILNGTNSMGIKASHGSVVWDALQYLGVPYVWGGATPRGFDCSGLTMYVFKKHGVSLPHYSGDQARMGSPVPANELQPADLVFFGNPIHHVGIYIGGGYFVHAPRTGDVVKISKLSEGYYSANFAWARRFNVDKPY